MKGRENQRDGSRRTEKKGNLGSVRREAFAAGRRWRSKTRAFCRTLSRLLTPLGGAPCKKKAWTRIQAFSLKLAVREGLIRCAHPTGRRWRSKTRAFCRTLSRLLTPLGGAPCKKKSLDANPGFLFEFGGERGVRTLDTLSRIHTFQACSFSHSDTSPFCCRKRFALSTGANVGESDLSVNPLISFS